MNEPGRAFLDPPWTLKVEFTRGCNLACRFCPIYADPESYAEKSYLDPKLLAPFAAAYGRWRPRTRIELTLRGEPTLNPRATELISILRAAIPLSQISLFTNGVRALRDPGLLVRLLESGANIVNVDCYNGTFERFRELATAVIARAPFPIDLRDFRAFSAYQRHPAGERMRVINLVPDIGAEERLVAVRTLHNNAGNADAATLRERWGIEPIAAPLAKGCARPFREFVFYHDGTVVLCCHDWKAESVLGRFPDESPEAIWYGERHLTIARALYARDRSGAPCSKCDYGGGFRLGLLKNPNERPTT